MANSKGGITQYVLQNWKFIDKSKFQFDFATMSKSLDFAEDLEKEGSAIHYIPCYAEQDKERFVYKFRKILLEGNYDIVHLHTKQWKSFLVEQIAKDVGIKKIIVHAHNTGIDTLDKEKREEEIRLHNQILMQLTEDVATDYWSCSQKASEFIFGNKISGQKIKIMNNAIDISKYIYNPDVRKVYREKLGIAEHDFVIGNVGRFVYQKNQEFLIKVFADISGIKKAGKQNYKLILVGNGECEKKYKKMVYEYGIADRVIFTGYRTDIPKLLQVMDIFCLPSRFEGLGIALIEAQASGMPCIVSDFIPREAILCDCVMQVPLNTERWKEKILAISKNNEFDKKRQDMEQKYMISVIVPVFNTAFYLVRCINSIINQTYTNLEIILVDDGSTDGSADICDRLQKQDKRIKVLHQKNRGVSNARNRALRIAKGDLIGFVDSDDYIHPDMYALMVHGLQGSTADIVTCGYSMVYEGRTERMINKARVPDKVLDSFVFLKYVYERDTYKGVAGYIWTRLFKRKLIINDCTGKLAVEFNNRCSFGEDVIFVAETSIRAKHVLYIDKALYYYVQHRESLIHSEKRQMETLEWVHAYEYIIGIYEQNGLPERILDMVKRMYVYRCGKTLETALESNNRDKCIILKEKIKDNLPTYVKTNIDFLDRIQWIITLLQQTS